MDSKEAIIYQALTIIIAVFIIVFITFVVTIFRYRRKGLHAFFEKMQADFSAIETEKKRTAADVHDGFGAYLTAIKLLTDQAFENVQVDDTLRNKIDETFRKAFASFRGIIRSIVPRTLQREGLYPAIKELISILFPGTSTKVTFEYSLQQSIISDDVILHIYRLVQELLNNVCKHAEATEAFVSVYKRKRFLIIEVSDNGKGFDKSLIEKHSPGLGLTNIENRILFLKGEVYSESVPGAGTRYQIILPLFKD